MTERIEAEHIVQIQNQRVKVTECRFRPRATTGHHRHEHDYVVVPLQDGKLRIVSADGESISELAVGRSYFRQAGVEHEVFNANDYDFAFVEIELRQT
jgi:beta-alanine degradation protein BauB